MSTMNNLPSPEEYWDDTSAIVKNPSGPVKRLLYTKSRSVVKRTTAVTKPGCVHTALMSRNEMEEVQEYPDNPTPTRPHRFNYCPNGISARIHLLGKGGEYHV